MIFYLPYADVNQLFGKEYLIVPSKINN
jgi:hypothetical protein